MADDFDKVLTAVKDSSIRSRAVMYLVILLLASTIILMRGFVYPAWSAKSINVVSSLNRCFDSFKSGSITDEQRKICTKNTNIIMGVSLEELKDGTAARISFDRYIFARIDSAVKSQSFELPVFGGKLHQNDFWVVTGAFILIIMIIMLQFMKRELSNIRMAIPYIDSTISRDLIISTQIFASSKDPEINTMSWFIRQMIFLSLYFMPFVIHSFVVYSDFVPIEDQFYITQTQIGWTGAIVEWMLEALSLFFLALVGWKCNAVGMLIEQEMRTIGKLKFQAK